MARLLTLGFENPHEIDLLDMNGITTGGKNCVRRSLTAYTGKMMMSILGNSEYTTYLIGANPTELYFGFAVKYPAAPTNYNVVRIGTGDAGSEFATYLGVKLNGVSSTISAHRGATALATSAGNCTPAADTWCYIEVWVKPLNSNGRFVIKVDGATVVDYTGDTTADNEYCTGVRFFSTINSTSSSTDFDDIVINDTSGSVNNTYPGVIHLLPIFPNAAGSSTDFDRKGIDLSANFVQARGNRAESWLEGVADENDLYVVEAPTLPAGATITNVIVEALAKSGAGTGYIRPMVSSNATESESASMALGTGWTVKQNAWAVDPQDSAAWTEGDLDTLEIGAKVKSS